MTNEEDKVKLSKKQIQDWINELRSGNYTQGGRYLAKERPDGTCAYCCLGVLAETLEEGTWEQWAWKGGLWEYRHRRSQSAMDCYLPASVLPESIQHHLSIMNDTHLFSFSEIADWIERQLLPRGRDA